MNRVPCLPLLLAAALGAAAASPALACGESMFNTGKGLEFQAYLAPRPATVLIYGTPDPTVPQDQRDKLLSGLREAGHKVVLVADADAYAQALRAGKVDLVIADAGAVDALATANGTAEAPRLLPVVPKGNRAAGGTFELFLKTGARLGQYLRAIDRAVASTK